MTKKIKRAVADSGREVVRGPGKAGIGNLIEVMAVMRGVEPEQVEKEFEGSGYGDFKGAVAETVVETLAPIRDRYEELTANPGHLESVLAEGADRARTIARATMEEVRERMGVGAAR
jgi:tryptophanyl-tRNA synthetase